MREVIGKGRFIIRALEGPELTERWRQDLIRLSVRGKGRSWAPAMLKVVDLDGDKKCELLLSGGIRAENGIRVLDSDGTVLWDYLGHAWKISYHTVRSMIECVKRLRRLLESA